MLASHITNTKTFQSKVCSCVNYAEGCVLLSTVTYIQIPTTLSNGYRSHPSCLISNNNHVSFNNTLDGM